MVEKGGDVLVFSGKAIDTKRRRLVKAQGKRYIPELPDGIKVLNRKRLILVADGDKASDGPVNIPVRVIEDQEEDASLNEDITRKSDVKLDNSKDGMESTPDINDLKLRPERLIPSLSKLILSLHKKYPLYKLDESEEGLIKFPLKLNASQNLLNFHSQKMRLVVKFDGLCIGVGYMTDVPEDENRLTRWRSLTFSVIGKPGIILQDYMLNARNEIVSGSEFVDSRNAVNGAENLIGDIPALIQRI